MNIRNLSLQKITGDDWTYNPDFQYADFTGRAELHKTDRIILFRKNESEDISAVSFQAIGLEDKKLIHTANQLMADIGISLRMGDSRNKIIKKYGTPDLIDCIEEGYYRYYNLNYHYSEEFFVTRYHYLLAPDLLVCFGMPKEHYQNLTELEIVNDRQMVSAIMEDRTACRELGCKIYPSKNRMRLVHQTIENSFIEGLASKIVCFHKVIINNSTVGKIQAAESVIFSHCTFEHVEFRGQYQRGYIMVDSCTFTNCVFHENFGDSQLEVSYSSFENCLFEGIRTGAKSEGFCIGFNEFTDCIFKAINWMGRRSGLSGMRFPMYQTSSGFGWMFRRNGLFSNVVRGGKMSHIVYHESGSISDNQLSDVVFEDVEVELYGFSFAENELSSVTFRNVSFDGWLEDNNRFVDCDTVEQGFGSKFGRV